jgi:diaminopimelate epimerase
MNGTIEFSKLSGSGNDFVCIDDRAGRLREVFDEPRRAATFARVLCRRGIGVGADGVIVATAPAVEGYGDVGARFFEPDGSEAELCGNGVGCFVRWILETGCPCCENSEVRVLTSAGLVRGRRMPGNYARVCIPLPENPRRDLQLDVNGCSWHGDAVNTGVPHLVTWVRDVESVDVGRWGRALRHHEEFQPRGVNVNFVQVLRPGEIALRTFEFGVEGETLACGTGSAAAAILTARRFGWEAPYTDGSEPVRIHVRSGDVLRVYMELDAAGEVVDLCLETVIRYVCRGELHEELMRKALEERAAAS